MTTSTFDTPTPILVDIQAAGGSLDVVASTTDITVVSVVAAKAGREGDERAAEDTTVDFDGTALRIRVPRQRGPRGWFGGGPTVSITVDVPSGSRLEVTGWAETRATGQLGDVVIDTGMGDVAVEDASSARVHTAMGNVSVGAVTGDADLKTSAGAVAARSIGGRGRLKSSAGDVSVGTVSGSSDLRTAAGNIRIGTSTGDITARTSAGEIFVESARSGAVRLTSSYGAIEVGVPHGTAAWVDTDLGHGRLHSELGATEQPADGDRTVEIHANTKYGDVRVRRSHQEEA